MPGRNDPCPCGSGKKYKKCCWRQDRLAPPKNVNAPAEPDLPAEPAPPEGPPDFLTALTHSASTPAELDAAEDDPLVERANEFWERFMAAPYEDKWNLVATMLAEDPAVCDGEMVFEMTNTLFEQAVDADEPDRLKELLNQLERHAPEAFAEERHYMLEMQGRIALIQQDEAGIARAFDALSPLAGKHLDLYYRLVSALNYHGKLDILHAGLRRARPFIAAADGLVLGAYEEFTEMLGTIELLHRLAENPDLTADDPVLLARFAEYELTLEPKILADQLDYRMGRKRPSWTLADFEFSHKKKAPAQQRFSYLLTAFAGEAHAETGIASTKLELARDELARYLVQRHAGELDDAPTPRRQRRKQKRATAQSAHPLCPDAKTLDFFLARLLGFLSFQHYEAFALFELLPAWLRFLARHGLLDEAARQHTLQEISYIKGELKTFAENRVNDPALAVNLAGWPDER